ncbi:LysR family transcriptional regulator [Celeribacter arenosi]|uniref:LysR family transcriptional regulator n=1 Tax=Celeribacter arenosi TaxID=792649 RepID=A0ABP7JVB5_9RHOB
MDTLLSLRVFTEVADHKSFTAVADRMGMSRAMASKHIQHIEARVGARLLSRNSRNVSLTEAGARYLVTVRRLLEDLSDAENLISTDTLVPRGTLKISMPVWMSTPAFARMLSDYHRDFPHVVFDFDLSSHKINLVEEGADLALRVAFKLDEGLIARKLSEVTFQMVAAPDFLDHTTRPQTANDLIDAPLLAYSPVASDGRIKFGGSEGLDVKMRPVMVSTNESHLHLSALSGMGYAILPNWMTKGDLDAGRLETVLPQVTWPKLHVHAIYADRSYLPAKVRSFLDFLASKQGLESGLS